MTYCDHTFFAILHEKTCVVLGCCYCGHIRHLYADGRLEIIKQEGEVIKKCPPSDNIKT